MGAPYSQDLRDRVLAACDRGMKTSQVAQAFAVCSSWVRRVKQRRRETGETTSRPMGGATVVKIDGQRLTELVRQKPDATLKELRQMLGVDCVESAICMALQRLKLSRKKSRCTRRSRTGPTSRRGVTSGSRASRGWTRAV
jgi:transposase